MRKAGVNGKENGKENGKDEAAQAISRSASAGRLGREVKFSLRITNLLLCVTGPRIETAAVPWARCLV